MMHSFQKMCGAPSTFFTKKNVAWLMLFLSALAAASLLGGRGSEPDRDARAQQRRLGATLVNFMDPKSVRERFLEYEDPVTDQISFPECVHMKTTECLTMIKKYLRENGLKDTISIEKVTKRKPTDEGWNKVVVVTNELGDTVPAAPSYPFQWNGRDIGPWTACEGQTPDYCCSQVIRQDVQDTYNGKEIECDFFTPAVELANYDSILPAGRTDAEPVNYVEATNTIFVIESPDGRTHELPVQQ